MKQLILGLYNKYRITFIAIVLITLFTFAISYIYDFDNFTLNIYLCFVDFVLSTFISYKILDVYKDKLLSSDAKKNESIKIRVFVVSIFTIIILHIINYSLVNTYFKNDFKYEILKLSYLLIPQFLIFYLEINDKNISMPKYVLMVFKNSLSHFIFTLIVFTGIIILYCIYEALIGHVNNTTMSSIMTTIFTFIVMTGYLISIDNTDYKENVFLKVLVYYVMQSIVFAGFIIVYAFMVNIIIRMELPPNQIYMVGIAVFFIGVITCYMSQAFDEHYKISKLMPILFIPILIMQYIAIFVRILNYGLSAYRYIAVMVLVFETIFIIMYILKYDKLKNLFLYAIVLVLITFYIPLVNIYNLPDTVNNTLLKNVTSANKDYKESVSNRNECLIYKGFSDANIDISGYDKLDRFSMRYEYDLKDNKYYDTKSSYKKHMEDGVSDLKNAKAYIQMPTSDTTYGYKKEDFVLLDIDDYVKKLEEIIISNNYDENKVQDNIDGIIEFDDKKIVITLINIRYEETNFDSILISGYLLTKEK